MPSYQNANFTVHARDDGKVLYTVTEGGGKLRPEQLLSCEFGPEAAEELGRLLIKKAAVARRFTEPVQEALNDPA